MSVRSGSPALCQVLHEDPELADPIPPGRRDQATRECTARELSIAPGEEQAVQQLVAARRPTVSTAASDLARRGLVTTQGEEWLLAGDPPVELLDLNDLPSR